MSRTIAVTGASGHLGNVVCRLLIDKGYKVKAMYNSRKDSLSELPLELIQGDVLNKADLEKLIDGCDTVIHSAAIISINGDPDGLVHRTNTEGPKNVLEVSRSKGVKRIIHISSVHAVMEEPMETSFDETRPYKTSEGFAYDFSKSTGEQYMLKESAKMNPEIVVIRPSCIIGPYDFKTSEFGKALVQFYQRKIPVMPKGGYNFVDVRDVAQSVINAIEKGKNGEVYLVTGKYKSMQELAATITKVTGVKTPKSMLSFSMLKSFLPFIKIYSKVTQTKPLFTIESITALRYGHPLMDNSKAINQLGHNCRPFEESIQDFYNWLFNNKRLKK